MQSWLVPQVFWFVPAGFHILQIDINKVNIYQVILISFSEINEEHITQFWLIPLGSFGFNLGSNWFLVGFDQLLVGFEGFMMRSD